MNPRSNMAIHVMAALMDVAATNYSEPCQDVDMDTGREAPWKVRLYGANKDRRAARKKRAKKLGRRR